MKTYLVGGAVRDSLLGIDAAERDWVVVGATPDQLLNQGFRQVGRDFPVFLHPQTGEEYALARTERKRGHGYTGFSIDSSPEVTLEQDLARRDLTVNAIARDDAGVLIDPYGGQRDLDGRVLRHVSAAFVEDPLRVLRVARFAARLQPQGFSVAPETMALMRDLADSGELEHLVAERVWRETRRALDSAAPDIYIQVLRSCGALAVLFPEIDALFGVPQPPRHHPEIDTGIHLLLCLRQAAAQQADTTVRVAVLLHDLGKALTADDVLPSHIGHERAGEPLVKAFAARWKLSRDEAELSSLVCRNHLRCHQATAMKPVTLLRLLDDLDAWRQPGRFAAFLEACEIDARGRTGMADRDYPSRALLSRLHKACTEVSATPFVSSGLSGPAIGEAVRAERLRVIEALRNAG